MTPTETSADQARTANSSPVHSPHVFDSVLYRPLATYAVGFAIGIWVASLCGSWAWIPAAILLAASCFLFVSKGRHRWLAILAVVGMSITGGALRYTVSRSVSPVDISRWAAPAGERGRAVTVVGEISNDPEPLPGRVSFILAARSIDKTGGTVAASGQIYVTASSSALHDNRDLDYGDVVSLHGLLETPKAHTNPGAFSWRDYLGRRGIYCTLAVKRPSSVSVIGRGGNNPVLASSWRIRRWMVRSIDDRLPSIEAAILEGILIGRRADLPPDLAADFVQTGTVHILASAGLHVGILIGCLWLLFSRLTLHRKVTAGSLIGILILYAIICGGRPSVTRAAIMAIVYLGALLFEREPDLPTALGAAALWILVETPYALLEPGFQLSYATVITLAIVMPAWDAFFRRRMDGLKIPSTARKALLWTIELAGMTLFAQIGSAPMVAAAYNETSLIGVVANLLVVPALFFIIPIGLLAVVFGSVPVLGSLLFKSTMPFLAFVEAVVRHFGEASGGFAAMQTPPTWSIVVYYGLLGVGAYATRRRLQKSDAPKDTAASGHS
jgi:competence protein ComEC